MHQVGHARRDDQSDTLAGNLVRPNERGCEMNFGKLEREFAEEEQRLDYEAQVKREEQRRTEAEIREWARKTCGPMEPAEIVAADRLARYWAKWQQEVGQAQSANARPTFEREFMTALLDRHNRLARKEDGLAVTFGLDQFGRPVVRYWSVYEQRWMADEYTVPARELAAMNPVERRLVDLYLTPRVQEGFMSTADAAQALGIKERRVRQLCTGGRMGRRVGRDWAITPEEIERNRERKPGPPAVAYERKGEWSGCKIRKAPTGFTIECWSRIQGSLTDDKYLLPYGRAAGGYEKDADLDAQHNDLVTVGEFLAEYALRENRLAKILRKGRIVL